MYHERGIRQPQIAEELGISQPRVSRLLKQAAELGIVRTVVTMPTGTYNDLEERVQEMYGLRDVVVVDAGGSGGDVIPALGAAAAVYLDATLTGNHIIGVSSWSETLMQAVDAMRPKPAPVASAVIQLLGGLGDPSVQIAATRLTGRLADLTGATPVFLQAPGIMATLTARQAMMNDASIAQVISLFPTITVALVGIGSLDPSPLARRSGYSLADREEVALRAGGAVGDVCFRYFDAEGHQVRTTLDQRLVGISAEEFLMIPRRIGVAGGERKFAAIRAALLGRWVNVLITDLTSARLLVHTER